jgi:O-antigen/teichoic acid export membrane protein
MSFLNKLKKSKLFKETITYTLVNVLDKSIPFLLLPIYSRILPSSELGIFMVYQALYQIFIPFVTLSLDNSIVINYYHFAIDKFKSYFSNIFYFFIFFYIAIYILIFSISSYFSSLLDFSSWGILMILNIIFFQYINDITLNLWRVERKAIKYGLFTIIQTLLKNSIGFIFVIYFAHGWKGIVEGHLAGVIIMSLFSLSLFIKKGYLKFHFKELKSSIIEALRISLPLSIHRVAAWLGNAINRVIINKKMGAKATASFGIGSTFNMILTILIDALNKAYGPELYSNLKILDSKIQFKIVRLTCVYYFLIISLTLFLAIFGYFTVDIIFGEKYVTTKLFIIPLTISAGLNGLYKLHVNYIFFTKKTFYITAITVITAIINIPLAYFLISAYGILGGAYSLLIVNFMYYILALYFSNRLVKMNWLENLKKIAHV